MTGPLCRVTSVFDGPLHLFRSKDFVSAQSLTCPDNDLTHKLYTSMLLLFIFPNPSVVLLVPFCPFQEP